MKKEIEEIYKDIPFGITSSIPMSEPNQKIMIYSGTFNLMIGKDSIEIEGEVWFDWFPHINTKFNGIVKSSTKDIIGLLSANDKYDLKINDLLFGESYITNSIVGSNAEVSGQVLGLSVIGDRTIPISKITFSIPNLRDFWGLPNKLINEKGGYYSGHNRLIFENKDYVITIDKSRDYKKSFESLTARGGYFLLYAGEIQKKSGNISFENLNKLHHCFSTFLSFINGQRCSLLFLQGIHDNEIIWTDYTGYESDLFKHVHSWPQKLSINGLSELWNEFYELWNNNANDEDFLVSAVHWYIEANANSGYLEGSIIMIQTALELIYNWLVIEKRKLIYGKDADNISASNKIRLLLSQFGTNIRLPQYFINMKSYLDSNKDIYDEIDLFVQIRNAIIHSQEDKRRKLSKISHKVKYEAQQLGLWYIEISLLNILKFNGKYRNRCSGKLWTGEDEEDLPKNKFNE
ncbi:MAG: hypothetical protein J0L99_04355 [Chitinophagales bacterium]|nr:hypothetical protein [Chitinophagales bacterium]